MARKTIREGDFDTAATRLLTLIAGNHSPASINDRAFVEYFQARLHRVDEYDENKPLECAVKTSIWINSLEVILGKTISGAAT